MSPKILKLVTTLLALGLTTVAAEAGAATKISGNLVLPAPCVGCPIDALKKGLSLDATIIPFPQISQISADSPNASASRSRPLLQRLFRNLMKDEVTERTTLAAEHLWHLRNL